MRSTIVLLLALAACSSAAAAPRPWQDTSGGIYVFNDQLTSNMTDALYRFSANHYVGCQKMLLSDTYALRSYNANFLVLHYRLGLGLGYRTADAQGQPTGEWLYIIEGNQWIREWPSTVQDQWFFPYGGSSRVYQLWGWYLINPDNASYRSYWTGEVLGQLQANENDGLFADSFSVPNYLGGSSFRPNLPDYDPTFEAQWSARIERWIAYLKTTFGTNYKLIPNVGAWITTRDVTDYSVADGVMIEGFAAWDDWDFIDLADWQLQMDRALGLINEDRIVICQSYINDTSNLDYRGFLLASYLMIKGAHTYLNMEYSMEPEWFPEYAADLGQATGGIPASMDSLWRSDWGVYARQFEHGLAVVNPSDESRSFNVGSGYQVMVAHGGGMVPENGDISGMYLTYQPAASVQLPAHSGAVFVNSGPTPGVLSVTPSDGLSSVGPQGGPFSPSSKQYTLANTGGASLSWTATHGSANWVSLSPTSGSLNPGADTVVTVSINSAAASLAAGAYSDTVQFKNSTTSQGNTTRSVSLNVQNGRLSVSPSTGLTSSGKVGGPFSPSSVTYTLSNPGNSTINWKASHGSSATWVSLSKTTGTLSPGGSTTLAVSINSNASSLPAGTYGDTVSFTNTTNGQGSTSRGVALTVTSSGGKLQVSPSDGFTSSGYKGGTFTPGSKRYTLTNIGTSSINWTVTCSTTTKWLAISPKSGSLAKGASVKVQLAISSYAKTMAKGTYTDTVRFNNATNGSGNTTRSAKLTVK